MESIRTAKQIQLVDPDRLTPCRGVERVERVHSFASTVCLETNQAAIVPCLKQYPEFHFQEKTISAHDLPRNLSCVKGPDSELSGHAVLKSPQVYFINQQKPKPKSLASYFPP